MSQIVVAVVSPADTDRNMICTLIRNLGHQAVDFISLNTLNNSFKKGNFNVVIFDLDSLSLTNADFNKLKRKDPGLQILAVSNKTRHPEIQEAFSSSIYACFKKPVDEDELSFLLNSISSMKTETKRE